jgi:beta-glucosidase
MPDATASTFGGVNGQVVYADGVNVGYRWYQANHVTPLFSFGYGLSYTRFRFSGLQASTTANGGMAVKVTVTNVGPVAGTDVVQTYLGYPAPAGEAPRQLRGFTRVTLAPQQSKSVLLTLAPGDLATWDTARSSWVVAAGSYQIFVGDGSDLANLPVSAMVPVAGATLGADSGPAHPAP